MSTRLRRRNRSGDTKFLHKVKECTHLFLSSTSIRGCNRIVKTDSRFLKLIWSLYLVITTLALFISTFYIVVEYLGYAVNMQSYIDMDTPRPFPDVTFCNHEQFSDEALKRWKSNTIRSPTKFSRDLRNNLKQLNSSDLIPKMYGAIVSDSITNYYQVLDWPEHKQLGHTRNTSIKRCMIKAQSGTTYVGEGCHDSSLEIETISDPYYFNCFTIKVRQAETAIEEIRFLIWLGQGQEILQEYTRAFPFDLFQQGIGIKVVLHEPNSMPKIDRFGVNIEPGRMNELNFRIEETRQVHSVKNKCYLSENRTKIVDLESHYNYDFEICVGQYLQNMIINKCKCLFLYYPRVQPPSKSLPYCGRVLDDSGKMVDIMKRVKCVQEIVAQAANWRKKVLKDNICQRKCKNVQYKMTDSVTKWRVTNWQLHWTKVIADIFTEPDEMKNTVIDNWLRSEGESPTEKDRPDDFRFTDRYTYVIIKRESNDTFIHREQLVLTLSALFSRIGGICSLYIGLTLAVAIELLEFLYYSCKRKPKNENDNKNNESDECFLNTKKNQSMEPRESLLKDVVKANERTVDNKSIWLPQSVEENNLVDIPS